MRPIYLSTLKAEIYICIQFYQLLNLSILFFIFPGNTSKPRMQITHPKSLRNDAGLLWHEVGVL